MALVPFLGFPKLVPGSLDAKHGPHGITYTATYQLGPGQTLAQANLDSGDVFPEDSDAEIVTSEYATVKGSIAKFAAVVATIDREWEA